MEIQVKSEDQKLIETLKTIHFSLPCGIQQRETVVMDRKVVSYMFFINRKMKGTIRIYTNLTKNVFLQINKHATHLRRWN